MKKYFYMCINPVRKLYWFLVRPHTKGAKMLIERNGRLLMIRNTYGHKMWTFPGGGVAKNETYKNAAIREAWEEVGIKVTNPTFIGQYVNTHQYKIDAVECYYTQVDADDFTIDPGEIMQAQWLRPSEIPKPLNPRVPIILAMRENYIKLHH